MIPKRLLGALALTAVATTTFGAPKVVPGKPGDQDIVTIAQEAGFTYLLGAVGCLTDEAGNNPVVDLLTGDDKYTVFAPTNDAFIALQQALGITEPSPDATCALPDDVVFDVLAYHVTEGRRFSNSVFNRRNPKSILMLNGKTIRSNPNLTLTDVPQQVISVVPPLVNVNASNGVIHQIDTVMLPFVP